MDFKQFIRPGRTASDITPLFANANAFAELVDKLSSFFQEQKVDKVACIEGRGFILGAAVAIKLGAGVIPIRKKGSLQNDTHEETFRDYSGKEKTLEVHKDAILPNESIVIIDDWLETGASVEAAIKLIEQTKGKVVGVGVFMDDSTEQVKKELEKYKYKYVEKTSPKDVF
ncbi:MAG: adenine phosphoribosyltransferase [Candidatus Levybacteria bacterium]|nr:adenine phosphoribosyltransferase [Candidatus Levybacteria bacterium]